MEKYNKVNTLPKSIILTLPLLIFEWKQILESAKAYFVFRVNSFCYILEVETFLMVLMTWVIRTIINEWSHSGVNLRCQKVNPTPPVLGWRANPQNISKRTSVPS